MRRLIFVLAFFAMAFAKHPIYISRTEIHYKPQRQSLEIAMKIFADDLQEDLSRINNEKIEIGTDREHPEATSLIFEYLQEHFIVFVNDQPTAYEYIGRENDQSDFFAVWVYLKVNGVDQLQSLSVHNSVLHGYQQTQENVVIVTSGNNIQRAVLRNEEAEKRFEF